MKFFVAVTDNDWFDFLAARRPEEVNFWRPGGRGEFRAIQPNELVLFKLHSPRNFIAGGGFFVRHSFLPVSIAWKVFGLANGVESHEALLRKVQRYRSRKEPERDPVIGCLVLASPFFWPPDEWIRLPPDWHPNIVQGKTYDTSTPIGRRLYEAVMERMNRMAIYDAELVKEGEPESPRYGKEHIIRPRLGQGAFRVVVMEAYRRRCAVTGAKVLPVLDAAHIKPFSANGPNVVNNGLFLRQDLHTLFDRGYITIDRDYRVVVSRRLKEDFDNGQEYYVYHGKPLTVLPKADERPHESFIEWHNEHVFLA